MHVFKYNNIHLPNNKPIFMEVMKYVHKFTNLMNNNCLLLVVTKIKLSKCLDLDFRLTERINTCLQLKRV